MMRPIHWLLAIIILSSITSSNSAQDKISNEQRLHLDAAKLETSRFLERFRATWDFRKTWTEFRSKLEDCGISVFDRTQGLKANPTLKGVKVSEALQKQYFVTVWNFYLLGGSYIFSLSPVTDRGPNSELLPSSNGLTSLKAFEAKTTFVNLLDYSEDRELATLRDVRHSLDEMNEFSVLLRNHMPLDAMKNDTWSNAVEYFKRRYGPNEDVINQDNDAKDFGCAIKRGPLYSIKITDQYFVWLHEGGKMKLITLVRFVD